MEKGELNVKQICILAKDQKCKNWRELDFMEKAIVLQCISNLFKDYKWGLHEVVDLFYFINPYVFNGSRMSIKSQEIYYHSMASDEHFLLIRDSRRCLRNENDNPYAKVKTSVKENDWKKD